MTESGAGLRVLVTRAAPQAGKLSAALREAGLVPVEVPVLEIGPPDELAPLDTALRQLNCYDWLLFTSANTVDALLARANTLNVRPTAGMRFKVAAVGEATAKALREAGFSVDLVPEKYVAEGLLEALKGEMQGRFLLARAAQARDVIPDALRAAGAQIDVVEAYCNRMPDSAPAQLRAAIDQGIQLATFTSSSSVTHLRDAVLAANLAWPLPGVKAVSIGPVTTETLKECGWPPVTEALPFDMVGLVAATLKAIKQ